jgi:hypothetical protein
VHSYQIKSTVHARNLVVLCQKLEVATAVIANPLLLQHPKNISGNREAVSENRFFVAINCFVVCC